MKPTRRGYGLIVVVLAGVALGAAFGARSLNAVVVPVGVALVAGAIQLHRATPPALERSRPEPGFPGETRTVELSVESGVPCRAVDDVGAGLSATDTTVRTAGDGSRSYEVTLDSRGERQLGPAQVVATDAFGLFNRRFTYDVRTPVLVYPPVRRLAPSVVTDRGVDAPGRGAFDTLREYVPGDPLRDIHWRTSAKRPPGGLLVAEYAADEETGVTVAVDTPMASAEAADAMASAAASVVLWLLESGVAVGVATPDGRLPERTGPRHRRDVLELLARTRSGVLDAATREAADLRVVADSEGVRLLDGGRARPFEDLVVGEVAPA